MRTSVISAKDLCTALNDRAKWTNKIIGQGLSSRLGVLEETITDVNLIELATSYPNNVLTKKYSRKEEGSLSGADWLWCIGEPGAWLLLLVQAKVINPKTGNCHYLNYRNGKQCQTLVKYARSIKAVPLYAIYAHIPSGYQPPPKASPNFASINSEFWACSWITPRRVKQLNRAKSRNLEAVLTQSIPWSAPFCRCPSGAPLGQAVADGFKAANDQLQDQHLVPAKESDPSRLSDIKPRVQWDSVDPTTVINTEHFPRAVERVLAMGASGRYPVGNVTIVSSQPIRALDDVKALREDMNGDKLYLPKVLQSDSIRRREN